MIARPGPGPPHRLEELILAAGRDALDDALDRVGPEGPAGLGDRAEGRMTVSA
ncbi:hypothetical protein [Streptomyces lancefieldiae]|uniref:Uncharacterized protein n=1 Tax=Streptomyces lancefieldiae TaxID=3075520 RepID=A0ABU3ALZ7_9ACTN|nr:hypothetical protein [Streptomyces sp. DSM 40712]MDT0610979.1 hypothetical protein [Streptomyces sp. DSM 40712]